MLKGKDVPTKFWEEVVNRTCCISKRVYLKLGTHKTPYEIWKGKKHNLKHLREFGSSCNMLNDKEQRGKFYAKRDEGFFWDIAQIVVCSGFTTKGPKRRWNQSLYELMITFL